MMISYIIISFINVFLHITKSIFVIKSSKFIALIVNCICYTFSAVVIKFIAETDLWVAMCVQAITNLIGWYIATLLCEKILNKDDKNKNNKGFRFIG